MQIDFGAVLVFLFLGVAFVFGSLAFGYLIRISKPSSEKHSIYECGEPTVGSPWVRYNSRFYNIALVYLLFDVELVLLIPLCLVYRQEINSGYGLTVMAGIGVFLLLLTIGLAYEWFYGNLDWIKKDEQK